MKRFYETPEIEIILLNSEDIMLISPGGDPGDDDDDDNGGEFNGGYQGPSVPLS